MIEALLFGLGVLLGLFLAYFFNSNFNVIVNGVSIFSPVDHPWSFIIGITFTTAAAARTCKKTGTFPCRCSSFISGGHLKVQLLHQLSQGRGL